MGLLEKITEKGSPLPPEYRPDPVKEFGLEKPEISNFRYGFKEGALGRESAEAWKQEQLDPWRGKVTSYMVKQLFEGRPDDKPLGMPEMMGLIQSIDPGLLQDKRFMAGAKILADTWNKEAAATQKALSNRAGNLYQSGNDHGAYYTPDQRQLMDRFGYLVPSPNAPVASSPGTTFPTGLLGPGQPTTSKLKSSPRTELFGHGLVMNPAQRNARKAWAAIGPEVAKSGLTAKAQQNAQTEGHMARRRFDQANPPGQYATRTDPVTGEQSRVWTGSTQDIDLGKKPKEAGFSDYGTARSGVERFFMPPGVMGEVKRLDPDEQSKYLRAVERFDQAESQGLSPTAAYRAAIDPAYKPKVSHTPTVSHGRPRLSARSGIGARPRDATAGRDSKVAGRINELVRAGKSPEWIRSKLLEVGIDPAPYSELMK